ncbi:MAG: hypothetical protein KGI56_01640 [Acidobacteriota bacterium]|nr:hypothetical protein [Acidobacteriota bacterium]
MSQAFDPDRDHRISRDEASGLIRAHQAQAAPSAHKATAFNRSAFEHLLAQPGAAGIRIYHARHADGSPTMVMVAVDQAGEDLASPQAVCMQNGSECPPFCASSAWL